MSEISRRVTLAWLATASTGALALEGCAAPAPNAAERYESGDVTPTRSRRFVVM